MSERSDQEDIRRQRRSQLLAQGVNVYPSKVSRTATLGDLATHWQDGLRQTVDGRISSIRLQGGSAFIDLQDETGSIQLFVQSKKLGADFEMLTANLDIGDFIEAEGETFTTKRGQPSLDIRGVRWLGKALRPLPSHWHGLQDVELQYRFRELDLITNKKSRPIFQARGIILKTIRNFLDQHGFLEVETPMLQAIPGGATAQPFVTHHNALDLDLYLRVAPELYLKRLIVGGLGRVYEIARCFRNEGIDHDHSPEFTQVELYVAYADYQWMMTFYEQLLLEVCQHVHGRSEFPYGQHTIRLKTPFVRLSFRQAIKELSGIDISVADPTLFQAARKVGIEVNTTMTRPQIIDEIFKTQVRPKIMQPTFVIDYPLELSPLAKKKHDDPTYTERFQLLLAGTELGNAFSELNDPVDQRQRFEAQEKLRAKGDEEAQRIDETFLKSLEYGMPPTAGLGFGIDRLTAVLMNQHNLKDVILFPTLRPES